MIKKILFGLVIVGLLALMVGFMVIRWYRGNSDSNTYIHQWLTNPQGHQDLTTSPRQQCDGAPFIIPTEGFIGLLWRDTAAPYNAMRRHTGIDIFGQGAEGTTPIYAAYDGLLTRLDDWHSTIIIQHQDPLQAGRTIWTYYTHMASRDGSTSFIVNDYPRGTYAQPIQQGALIGYQGAYNPQFPIAIHLHFSIVTSEPDGSFRNEAILDNTLDPSPYFGMTVNADRQDNRPVDCITR